MANIKSQIKRNRQNEKRRLRNRNFRGAARTAVNQARLAMDTGSPDAQTALKYAISLLDQAAERGVIHPNNAARRKSRLMGHLAALSAQPAALQTEEPDMTAETSMTEEEAATPKKKASARKNAAKEANAKKTVVKKPAVRKSTKK